MSKPLKIKVSRDLPSSGHLSCVVCQSQKSLNEEKIASYMSNGWPICCGYTMTWITPRQEQGILTKEENDRV